MTAEQTEIPVRAVVDNAGHTWHVYVVVAKLKFDPSSEKRRRNWLALECGSDRRYISPVPPNWERWSDELLLGEIATAKPDLRA